MRSVIASNFGGEDGEMFMTRRSARVLTAILAALVGYGLLLAGCGERGTGDGETAPLVARSSGTGSAGLYSVDTMDVLTEQLAKRAQMRLGNADDFQIIPTQAVYEVGTLMRQSSTIPIAYDACLPPVVPRKFPAPSLFPSFIVSRETAASLGLDEAVLKGIANAGAELGRSSAIRLEFADSSIVTLSDSDVERLAAQTSCAAHLRRPVWLVRGYIMGKRTFRIDHVQTNEANAKVARVANFDIKLGSGADGLAISDAEPVGFLQIISALKPAVAADPITFPDRAPASSGPKLDPSIERPSAISRTGRTYIQRDKADASGDAARLVSELRAAGLSPEERVETIPSEKMPSVAQVRYFNDGDVNLARRALVVLQLVDSNAKLVRVQLPSPAGQLEVWLARAAAAGATPLDIRARDAAVASKVLRPQR